MMPRTTTPVSTAFAWYHSVVSREGQLPNDLLDKSALYQRLLEGKRPLVAPPPLRYSYPWYELLESDTPLAIEPPRDFPDAPGRVMIEQGLWKLLSRSENAMQVTYSRWESLGVTWRVWRALQPAADARPYLCSHHDPALGRLTTPEQIDAEARYHAEVWRRQLDIVSRGESLEATVDALTATIQSHTAAPENIRALWRSSARQRIEPIQKELAERQQAGLPTRVSDSELQARQAQEREQLLGQEWQVVDGELLYDGWFIQRETPSVLGDAFYLTCPEFAEGETRCS